PPFGLHIKSLNIDLNFSVRLFLHICFESGNNLPFLTTVYDKNTISAKYLEYHIRAIATPAGVLFWKKY
ncbi:MAG: hypothetical protein Q4C98_11025, partial [Capnocytophaga sp.]|nr:hypothetical protein [Capnocytophaga sp.]